METVMLDKTGKIYFPKEERKKMEGKKYVILGLPDGDVVLHELKKSKDPLKEYAGFFKTKKTIKQLREDALEQAYKDALHVRRH